MTGLRLRLPKSILLSLQGWLATPVCDVIWRDEKEEHERVVARPLRSRLFGAREDREVRERR